MKNIYILSLLALTLAGCMSSSNNRSSLLTLAPPLPASATNPSTPASYPLTRTYDSDPGNWQVLSTCGTTSNYAYTGLASSLISLPDVIRLSASYGCASVFYEELPAFDTTRSISVNFAAYFHGGIATAGYQIYSGEYRFDLVSNGVRIAGMGYFYNPSSYSTIATTDNHTTLITNPTFTSGGGWTALQMVVHPNTQVDYSIDGSTYGPSMLYGQSAAYPGLGSKTALVVYVNLSNPGTTGTPMIDNLYVTN